MSYKGLYTEHDLAQIRGGNYLNCKKKLNTTKCVPRLGQCFEGVDCQLLKHSDPVPAAMGSRIARYRAGKEALQRHGHSGAPCRKQCTCMLVFCNIESVPRLVRVQGNLLTNLCQLSGTLLACVQSSIAHRRGATEALHGHGFTAGSSTVTSLRLHLHLLERICTKEELW